MSPAAQAAASSSASSGEHTFPHAKLRLKCSDLAHPGTKLFFSSLNPVETMSSATANVLRLLYRSPSDPDTTPPPTRSITLILRDMSGVAYTTGSDLDNDHKEVHFAVEHISNTGPARATSEVTGVITHEFVHCLQWNALGTCPGGLIEGIADWVRLRCDLVPPHWKREVREKWDDGYQHTAYFLDYLEKRFGDGFVRRLNEKLRLHKYDEEAFWTELTGSTVGNLFQEYLKYIKDENKHE